MKIKKPALKKSYVRGSMKFVLIGGMLLVGLSSLNGFAANGKANEALLATMKEEAPEEKENFATSPAASGYANKFLKEYFTWDIKDAQGRKDRLAPFLMPELDQMAGLYIEGETKNSKFHSSELWKIEETGENTSLVTYKVLHTLNYTEEKKVKKKTIKNVIEKGPYEKWIQVPIITDGTNFKVNGLPMIISKPAEAVFEEEEKKKDERPDAAASLVEEIRLFLPTFFKQYTNGEQDQLNYLTDDLDLRPLGGVIAFQELQEITVKEGKDEFIVKVNALFEDSSTKALMLQTFEMTLTQKDGHWLVKKLNETQGGTK